MKAKYKLGTFVKFSCEGDADHDSGVINAVVTRSSGYSYMIESQGSSEVQEDEITSAYREVKPRKVQGPRKSSNSRSSRSKRSSTSEASATQ